MKAEREGIEPTRAAELLSTVLKTAEATRHPSLSFFGKAITLIGQNNLSNPLFHLLSIQTKSTRITASAPR